MQLTIMSKSYNFWNDLVEKHIKKIKAQPNLSLGIMKAFIALIELYEPAMPEGITIDTMQQCYEAIKAKFATTTSEDSIKAWSSFLIPA